MVSVRMSVPARNATPSAIDAVVRTRRSLCATIPRRVAVEHGVRPPGASCSRGRRRRSGARISSTMWPSARKMHPVGVAGRDRVVGDHDDGLAELARPRCAGSRAARRRTCESRAPVGSSAKTICGRLARARAAATRCCWPPESCDGRWREPLGEPDGLDDRLRPSAASGLRPAIRIGSTMFSAAVMRRQQVERLEDEADLVATQQGERLVVERGDLGVAEVDLARRRAGRGRRARAAASTCRSRTAP